jgi:small subunit ribosomal protein S16
VVAIDSRRSRDGRALEILGFYDPLSEPATVQVDPERFAAWVSKGALPSATVARLMKLNRPAAAQAPAAVEVAPAKPAPAKPAPAKPARARRATPKAAAKAAE